MVQTEDDTDSNVSSNQDSLINVFSSADIVFLSIIGFGLLLLILVSTYNVPSRRYYLQNVNKADSSIIITIAPFIYATRSKIPLPS